MNKILCISLFALLGLASAQSADQIVSNVDAAAKAAKDVSFKVSGTASLNGANQKLDLDVQAIPAQKVLRINFNAPDSLADNVVVTDGTTVQNYLYLTNQITVQTVQKASGGMTGLDFSQFSDLAGSLKANYTVKLLGVSDAAGGKLYQLQATPKAGGSSSVVWISDQGWRPTRVQLLDAGGKVAADLSITNYKTNSGLVASRLKSLPKDAQIVKR